MSILTDPDKLPLAQRSAKERCLALLKVESEELLGQNRVAYPAFVPDRDERIRQVVDLSEQGVLPMFAEISPKLSDEVARQFRRDIEKAGLNDG